MHCTLNSKIIAAVAGLALTVSGAAPLAQDAEQTIPVTLAVTTQAIGPAQSPYTSLPKALGHWPEAGLDVEVIGVAGSSLGLQAVLAGQVDAAVLGFSTVIAAVNQGRDVVGIYNVISRQFQPPAVPCDSPIQTPADFAGKTVGVSGLESGTIPLVKALALADGVDPNSMTFVAAGVGEEAMLAMEADRIQIWAYGDDRYAEFENLGGCVRFVTNEFYDSLGYQVGVAVTRDWLEENRETACELVRGIALATEYALANPLEAARLHWELYPESRPENLESEEAAAVNVAEARFANMPAVEGLWGNATDEDILSHVDYLSSLATDDTTYGRDPALYFDATCIEFANQ